MYCPKCSTEAAEGQRFCKTCGTNLQLINSALSGSGGAQGPFGLDLEALKQSAMDFRDSWKSGWSEHAGKEVHRNIARNTKRQIRDELKRRNLPNPHQWMSYSWQHNLRSGLLSLLGGAGLGVFLYFFGQEAINSHIIQEIPKLTEGQKNGIEYLMRILWLISLIPMLKGLGHIIYASFFAESMGTLSERYTVRGPLTSDQTEPLTREQTGPLPTQPRSFEALNEPPASVTENTTKFFEEAKAQRRRETQ
jgi:hypothetical protein